MATGCSRILGSSFWLQLFAIAFSKGDEVTVEHPNCRLFLAESTIPNAGLGIFTGIDLQEGDAVAEPDIVIPLHDQPWHAGDDLDFWFLWNEYSWQATEVGMNYDMEDGIALVIGTGCMPNCNFALINAHEGKPDYDHAGLHRSKDVGTSGFTGYYNQKMITTRAIPAGGEIFVSYGEQWFTSRSDEMGGVPLEGSYHMVDEFLKRFKKMTLKYQKSDNPTFTRDLWDVVVAGAMYDTPSGNALPLTFEDMQSAQSIGSAETRLPYSIRTLEWLHENGRCMDNIRPGNSTIRQAGRGAFASRFIPKGGLVAPGPILHIPNRTSLNVYAEGEDGSRDTTKHVGMQLILNYCFGHRKSTVILCPYTSPSSYINHSSEAPNAKVVWSKDSTPNHNPHWLSEDVQFLKTTEKIGLSIDFIATRDIQPNEEGERRYVHIAQACTPNSLYPTFSLIDYKVFIDYGPEWEAAWKAHVKEWSPPAGSDNYLPASMVGEPLRTITEQQSEPYPDNIVFYCPYDYEPGTLEGPWVWQDEWKDLSRVPCDVISREAVSADANGNTIYSYDMVMLNEEEVEEGTVSPVIGIPSGEEHILLRVPRWAVEVRDKLYSKDEFLEDSFRHEMMMPDDVFPESWKNL